MMGGMERRIRCGGKPVTAVVLAGGRSRRMRADKAGLAVPGGTLLEHVLSQLAPAFDEVLVSVSRGQKIDLRARLMRNEEGSRGPDLMRGGRAGDGVSERRRRGPALVEDRSPGLGPLAGILAGLESARNDVAFVVACDTPDINFPFVRRLVKAAAAPKVTIAVPVTPAGQYEPLFAVYKRSAAGKIEALLRAGERSVVPLFSLCRTAPVDIKNAPWLRNLNTRRDYESYLRSLKKAGSRGRTSRARNERQPSAGRRRARHADG